MCVIHGENNSGSEKCAVEKEEWGGILISSINATIAFFLSIISYLKLDAQSEAHKTSAHQYDKLQSICEFSSGNLLLFTDMKNFKELGSESKFFVELQKTINSLEAKIKEIKETMFHKVINITPIWGGSSTPQGDATSQQPPRHPSHHAAN